MFSQSETRDFIQSSPPVHGSNLIQSGFSQLTYNPIHNYLVLNRTRKPCANDYCNAEL